MGLIQSVAGGLEQKADPFLRKREFLLPDVLQAGTMIFFLPSDSNWVWSLQTFRAELHYQFFWFVGLWTQTRNFTTGSPGSPGCQLQIVGLSHIIA